MSGDCRSVGPALNEERSLDDGGEAVGPVVTIAGEAADTRAFPAHHQPEAIVLDFVNPQRAGRRPGDFRRQARFDEAGRLPIFQISAWYIKRQNAGAR